MPLLRLAGARSFVISVPVSREDVLCRAVSSHARRLGAHARPNGGLLLRVPLRGHPPSFPDRLLTLGRRRRPQSWAKVIARNRSRDRTRTGMAQRIENAAPNRATARSSLVTDRDAAANEIYADRPRDGL